MSDSQFIQTDHFSLEIYMDSFNKRIRVDDLYGNISEAIKKAEAIANSQHAEKLIMKGRKEHYNSLMEHGYQCEAMIENYFLGSNLYFFCKYFTAGRRTSSHWLTEDHIVKNVFSLERNNHLILPPSEYKLKKVSIKDAKCLSQLYGKVFQIYPTPLNDPQYIEKTIKEGTMYYCFQLNGEIVSAASAEVNSFYKNAELTDCATLPEHRKHGLMKFLLEKLEADLKDSGIFCAYSIARALSFGMNAALHQLGYHFRGRLMNNCYIFDKLEDMNVWVKDLSKHN